MPADTQSPDFPAPPFREVPTGPNPLPIPTGDAGRTLVEVKGLYRSFGKVKAVDGVSFSFAGGQVHGFIGPNGAGKTTTMRIVATLDHPDEGDVLIDGLSAIHYPDKLRPHIGFMPDYLESFRDMVVEEYLDFYARAYRLEPSYKRRRLADVIEFTGLGRLLDRPVDRLSKGERQRLGLGRVLVNDPRVLILDEPAAGLDPRARVELRTLLRRLADKGKAVFVSSHILTELSEICDAVTIIDDGKIKASDSVERLHARLEAGTRVSIVLENPSEGENTRLMTFLSERPEVLLASQAGQGVTFSYGGDASVRAGVLTLLIQQGFRVADFHAVTSDLEDAFMKLTEEKKDR